ncbi:MAG: hypothetical protein QXH07_01300 [Thermoplasmata archaeon]
MKDEENSQIMKRLTETLYYFLDDPYELLIDLPGSGIENVRGYTDQDLKYLGVSDEELELVHECQLLHKDLESHENDPGYEKARKTKYKQIIMEKAQQIRKKHGLFISEAPTTVSTASGYTGTTASVSTVSTAPGYTGTTTSVSTGTTASVSTSTPSKTAEPKAEIVKKINTELKSDEEAYELFDMLDSKQIVDYMETSLAQEYFYQFTLEGREVIGISYSGTIAIAKTISAHNKTLGLGGLEVLPDVIMLETEDKYRAFVRAKDNATGLIVLGYAEMPKVRKIWIDKSKNEYTSKEDPFASTIAVSKATRNALRHLIPEKEIISLYNEWRQNKKSA